MESRENDANRDESTKHEGNEKEDLEVVKSGRARQNGMVIGQDAHPFLLDEVFVGSALSMLDMNSVDVCVSITGPDVVGETGVEVEGGNEVLDEREEEDEAVVHSCSRRRTKWMRAVVVW